MWWKVEPKFRAGAGVGVTWGDVCCPGLEKEWGEVGGAGYQMPPEVYVGGGGAVEVEGGSVRRISLDAIGVVGWGRRGVDGVISGVRGA